MPRSKPEKIATTSIRMFLVPCSCGASFVVSENYDRQGTAWTRYLKCPNSGTILRTASYTLAMIAGAIGK